MIILQHFAGWQSQGVRPYQEDDFGFFQPDQPDPSCQVLAVLADGMGGIAGGAQASAAAVEAFLTAFSNSTGAIPERLSAALHQANASIATTVAQYPTLAGMGCTLLAVVIGTEGLYWISVGDSLLLCVRDGQTIRLNADHSLAGQLAQQVGAGIITQRQADEMPGQNQLLSVVSGHVIARVDGPNGPYALEKNDRILLASDGILTLNGAQVAKICGSAREINADRLAKALIATVDAMQRPTQDNTTVLVLIPAGSKQRKSRHLVGLLIALGLVSVLALFLAVELSLLPTISQVSTWLPFLFRKPS